jgi:heme-degrading monooxygenase HmoA
MELRALDLSLPFTDQLETDHDGPVTVINTAVAPEGRVEALIAAWAEHARFVKTCPGFISTQIYQGAGDSRVMTNVAVWESVSALRNAFAGPEFQDSISDEPGSGGAAEPLLDEFATYPVLVYKVAVPGVCTA